MVKNKTYRMVALLFLLLFCVNAGSAQNIQNVQNIQNIQNINDLNQTIPLDHRVKIGTLPNGLKYYIQKNNKPEKRAELRLVVNVGSILEDEDQQGLAHFVEHMCFNGTKNFKKNELISYLQSVGVNFGADVNAYTSFDETVYLLTIPTDKQDIVNKGVQILEDWAHNVTFEDEEIDKERGVVIEEWRTGLGAYKRLRDKTYPVIFKGSRYAERLPIGKKEILENCKYETVKRFYSDWYRPELMSVIVVGDINPDEMEAKIKEHFSRIEPSATPRERKAYDIPDHKETLITTATDKEATTTRIQLIYKRPLEEIKTYSDFRRDIVYDLLGEMVSQRLTEIAQQANPPYAFAYAYSSNLLRPKNSYTISATLDDKDLDRALRVLLRENKRAFDHGFSQAELENYKKDFLAYYERSYNERDKTDSYIYTYKYVNNFLVNNAAPSTEWRYEFVKKILPTINVDELNQVIKSFIKDENLVIAITGPEKDTTKQLSDASVKAAIKDIFNAKVEPYVYKEISQPLMANRPVPGKIIKERNIEPLGAIELTLSNGVKVILKPTDFKNDQIQMRAFSFGGTSLVSDEDALSATVATNIVASSGLANFSDMDLQKLLAGKNTYVSPYIASLTEGLNGSTTPKELETLLQLTNLYFSQPRKDEAVFSSTVSKYKTFLENSLSNPNSFYYTELQKTLTQNHPRANLFKKEDISKISLDRAFSIYQERFSDISDFTFFFVGNIDINQIKPLLENYLGSLVAKNQPETFKDLGVRPPVGALEREFKRGKDPKSLVTISFNGELQDGKDKQLIKSLAEGLTIKLIEVLREEKSGVYGTSARAYISKYPYSNYSVSISFSCAPENVKSLINAAYGEIQKVQQNGPTPEDLNKVKEAQKRDLEISLKENYYWIRLLEEAYYEKTDASELTESSTRKHIEELSIENLQQTAQKYLKMDNRIVVVMNPEN